MKQERESCFSEAFRGDRNHDKPRSFCTLQNDPSFEIFPPIDVKTTKLFTMPTHVVFAVLDHIDVALQVTYQ